MQNSEIIQPLAIGSAIADNGDKTIPSQTATGTATSSISKGFLPITSEPLDDGGQAPERTDFNGMFYLATDQRVFLQNGGVITYNDDVATAIGGYPQGAILGYITSTSYGFVKSLIDNNQYNFVTTPSYINGVNWEYVGQIKTISLTGAVTGSATFNTGNSDTISINTTITPKTFTDISQTLSAGVQTSLSSILPNDNYTYLIWVYNYTSAKSNTAYGATISTDVFPSHRFTYTDGDSGRESKSVGIVCVPVGSGRYVTVSRASTLIGYMKA